MIRKTLSIALLALGLGAIQAAAANAANTDKLWVHIHVRDAKDGVVSINLPISVIDKMANVIPTDGEGKGNAKLRFNDDDITVAELRDIWNEVRKQPDATFITVDELDSKVRVAKKGGYLLVRSHDKGQGRNEEVEMKIPGTVVDALLSAPGEQFNVTAALQALARHGEGELVTVTGEGETVRIWVDASSEGRTAR